MATADVNKSSVLAGTKRRFKIWMMFIVLFLGWAGYTIYGQIQQHDATTIRLSAIEAEIEATTKNSDELKKHIERLNDPEYIAQLATKEQGMVKKGEQQIFSE